MSIRPALQRVGPVVFLIDENTGDLIGVQRKDLSIRLFSLGSTLRAFEEGPFPFVSASILKGGADAPYDALGLYDDDTVGDELQSQQSVFNANLQTLVPTPNQVGVTQTDATHITFSLPQDIATISAVTFKSALLKQLLQDAGQLTLQAAGTGAGTGPTWAFSGGGVLARLDLTAGSAAASNTLIGTFLFPNAFASPPQIALVPANRSAAALQASAGTTAVSIATANILNDRFALSSGPTTALVNGTVYAWHFLIAG